MDAAAADLLAALSTPSSHAGLHSRFASYLLPLSDHLPKPNPNPSFKPPARKAKKQPQPQPPPAAAAALRPLAKRFLPFLCHALHLLPTLLRSKSSSGGCGGGGGGGGGGDPAVADELLEIYELLLNCLAAISPCLAGKPYSVLLQRGRFVGCLEAGGRYDRAEAEATAVLDALSSALSPPPPPPKSRRGATAATVALLPDPELVGEAAGGADPDVATLAMELVVYFANCAWKGKSKEAATYKRVIALVVQVQPWLRILHAEVRTKYHSLLVNTLSRCASFLAAEFASFDVDLVHGFCTMALRECAKASTAEHLPGMARRICSSVDLGWEGSTALLLDVLKIVVESVVCACKVNLQKAVNEFLELVAYFFASLSSTNRDFCICASKLLYEQGGYFSEVSSPISSILFVYATGFYISTEHKENEEHPIISAGFLNNDEYLEMLSDALDNLARYFSVANDSSFDSLGKDSGNLSTQQDCSQSHGNISFLSYLDSLEFVCKILLQYANASWKHLSEGKGCHLSARMSYVSAALRQFSDSVLAAYSCTRMSEGDKEKLNEKRGTLFKVIISATKLSFMTNETSQKNLSSIECAISSRWTMLEELKFLISSLTNICATLYNIGHFEQASIALKLCYQTILAYARLSYCRLSVKSEEGRITNDLPKGTIKDIIADAFKRIAVIADTLHKCGAKNICEIVVRSLFELLAAGDISENLNSALVLIKQWVKIMLKDFGDNQGADNTVLLYPFLVRYSSTWPKKMIGKILEQELLVYRLMEHRGAVLCRKMQQMIMDILLNEIYCSKEYHLERSRIFVRKACAIRASGAQNITSCLDCLSVAISLLQDISLDPSQGDDSVSHQLAIAYCLHAHCAQEANLGCKVILQNIRSAISLWSKVDNFADFSLIFERPAEMLIPLLCSMVDLLAMKGCFEFLFELCKLMIMIWKQENLPLEKLFSLLFTNGSLRHTLCNFPIDEQFISNVSQQLGVNSHTTEFWTNCYEGHPPYLYMFLQRVLPADFVFSESSEQTCKRLFDFGVNVDEIKKAASSLVSQVPLDNQSAFLAGYLYYDLSERLSSRGQLIEAFSCAKEALQLRKKLLKKKFKFHLGQSVSLENRTCTRQDFVSLEALGSTVAEIWPDSTKSGSIEDFFLTPWNVLRCYLESILQVASIHESAGNGAEAELLFRTGQEISYLHGLPTFGITFTSLLGQLYRKRQLWDAAESELENAKNLLAENDMFVSCKRCKLTLEILVDMQTGDLFWSRFEKDFHKQQTSNLSNALGIYWSALEKLKPTELECPFGSSDKPKATCILSSEDHIVEIKQVVANGGRAPSVVKDVRSPSCTVCAFLGHILSVHQDGLMPSNSGKRTLKKKNAKFVSEEPCSNSLGCRKKGCLLSSNQCSRDDLCVKFGCWSCLLANLLNSGSIQNILHFRWECIRRRHLVALLLKIARALGAHGGKHGAHEVHNIYWQCITLLYFRSFPQDHCGSCDLHLIELILDGSIGDFLSMERAEILYDMSFFLLKGFLSEQSRSACCRLCSVQMSDVVPWLLKAFMLSQQSPSLSQEISKLLACIFLLSTVDSVQLPFCSRGSLSLNHWAAYFHQNSVGTYLNCLYLSMLTKLRSIKDSKGILTDFLSGTNKDISKFLRFPSENMEDLEKHITDFFHKLPSIPIICVSMLDNDFVNLLGENLLLPSFFPAWILLSRFDSTSKPITMLLPVDHILEEGQPEDSSINELATASGVSIKNWECPWGYNILDYVAPSFKKLLGENFLSLSSATLTTNNGQPNYKMWWSHRMKLNTRLDKILNNMEESWLGPWGCLLLGHHSAHQLIEQGLPKLVAGLESEVKLEVNTTLAKAILGGVTSVDEAQACISQIISYKGYFGMGACCGKDQFRAFHAAYQIEAGVSESLICLIENTVKELSETVDRDPVIFVLDTNVQMLPWENFPVLRNQEIYRMPSVGSVCLALTRNYYHHKDESTVSSCFPVVDPFNTFYLLNPSGDLSSTQEEFDQLFRNLEWKGKAGGAPTTEELVSALRNHDLFLYFGHGSGTQYVSGNEIEKLDQCAAALLMGCSSGTLHCKGCYAPQGAPLSYILAGSPSVIANLWDVSDKDIDRFSKALLDSWLRDNSVADNNCARCCQLTKEFESMSINTKGDARTRRRVVRGQKLQQPDDSKRCNCGSRRIASYISEARRACRLPFMIGASPVCYGVPTIIRQK